MDGALLQVQDMHEDVQREGKVAVGERHRSVPDLLQEKARRRRCPFRGLAGLLTKELLDTGRIEVAASDFDERAGKAPDHLPEKVRGFDARHDALSRTYLYRISRRRTAFDKRYVWWVRDRLNFTAMTGAAKLFAGRHDFASFCENAAGQTSTVVVVEKSEMLDWEREIHYRVEASHFLWKMVRRLAGTLVEVGRGNLGAADVENLLKQKSGEPAKWTAPPSGLFLERVRY
jgi:hypothetical protein